ncbi:MAG TPA: ABC transporter ATP-binding protein [Acidimicrobiales bacterium]|nr:ABC transporter ATP-binding protein [Acidimicrobiales bacterium]
MPDVAPTPRLEGGDTPAVECRDLVVSYGELTAVDHLSFAGYPGEILALLGPNGAGKTSTVETLEGYRRPASGSVRVLGLDPRSDHADLVARIGVMLQSGGVYPVLGPRRVLRLFARYYDRAEDPDALMELVGLGAVASTPSRRLSGGERQRLSLALALIGRPEVVFLDEPTAGVDPEGRLEIRRVIAGLRDRGACVLLTTHELPEAERLADRVVIVNEGRAVAQGTVAELAAAGGPAGIRFAATSGVDLVSLSVALDAPAGAVTEGPAGEYVADVEATPARVAALATWLAERGLELFDLRAGRRSLEEVYLEATRAARSIADGTMERR